MPPKINFKSKGEMKNGRKQRIKCTRRIRKEESRI